MANNNIDPKLLMYGAIGAAVLLFSKKITDYFFKKSGAEIEQENRDEGHIKELSDALKEMQKEDYFNPTYFRNVPGAKILTVQSGDLLANKIHEAKGFFNDDEAAVYGVFQALTFRTQVSFIAWRFYTLYNKSLIGYLQENFLNEQEIANVAILCNRLKK